MVCITYYILHTTHLDVLTIYSKPDYQKVKDFNYYNACGNNLHSSVNEEKLSMTVSENKN